MMTTTEIILFVCFWACLAEMEAKLSFQEQEKEGSYTDAVIEHF